MSCRLYILNIHDDMKYMVHEIYVNKVTKHQCCGCSRSSEFISNGVTLIAK